MKEAIGAFTREPNPQTRSMCEFPKIGDPNKVP